LTESAANRVKTHFGAARNRRRFESWNQENRLFGLRYVVNYADAINPEDAVFEARGVKVVVDPLSLPLIDGTLVDFVQTGA